MNNALEQMETILVPHGMSFDDLCLLQIESLQGTLEELEEENNEDNDEIMDIVKRRIFLLLEYIN